MDSILIVSNIQMMVFFSDLVILIVLYRASPAK
jgi:hypothetical protein